MAIARRPSRCGHCGRRGGEYLDVVGEHRARHLGIQPAAHTAGGYAMALCSLRLLCRPPVWWYLTELPQGRNAARAGELFQVRGGSLRARVAIGVEKTSITDFRRRANRAASPR